MFKWDPLNLNWWINCSCFVLGFGWTFSLGKGSVQCPFWQHQPLLQGGGLIYSCCLAAAAKWLSFRVLAPLLLDSALHPDIKLEKATACSAVWLGIGSCAMLNVMRQGVLNCVMHIPHHVTQHHLDTAKNVLHWADIEHWKLGCSQLQVLQHRNSFLFM